jgi:hypothetical protein
MKTNHSSIDCIKGLLFTLVLAGAASASAVTDNQKILQNKMDSIDVMRGVEVGGSIRSAYFRSYFDSKQDLVGHNTTGDREQNEFVSFDLNLGFRPWENTKANVMIRMFGGMQDYFAAAAKTVSVGWLNIEGRAGDQIRWVVGDFRQQYSPLTLNSPELELVYEPTIFQRNRKMARNQVLLDSNQRNLQGANLQYRGNFGDGIGEVRAEAMFSRLRRVEILDFSGAMGNLLPNEGIQGASQSSGMNKFLAALNLESFPLKKNLMVGATQMLIWDDANSLVRENRLNTFYIANGGLAPAYRYKYGPVNPWDTLPQNTSVTSFRLGADGAGIVQNKSLILSFTAEYALSADDVYDENAVYILDSLGAPLLLTDGDIYTPTAYDTAKTLTATKSVLDGTALLAHLDLGYQKEKSWVVKVGADYIMNDSGWFNNLAQSPSFIPHRIMNSEKDGNTAKYGVNSPLYSTFDAMYHFTPKYNPVGTTNATDDNGMMNGQVKSYNVAPYSKNSWTSAVLTRKELALAASLADPTVQMALPNGLATSNRVGIKAVGIVGYGENNAVELQGIFTQLEESKAIGTEKAKFNEMGGGAKVDVFKLLGFAMPLELSGSYKFATRTLAASELATSFLNAGFYWRYYKRFGISAGFQQATMDLNAQGLAMTSGLGVDVGVAKGEQQQWMVGLDYSLSKTAWLAINYGIANIKNTYARVTLVDSNADGVIDPVTNWPDYVNADMAPSTTAQVLVHEFSMNQLEATINVGF